jgi:hypothetical protein
VDVREAVTDSPSSDLCEQQDRSGLVQQLAVERGAVCPCRRVSYIWGKLRHRFDVLVVDCDPERLE